MSAATVIADAFGEGADLYKDVLETTADASSAQLRKAYYQRALKYHPDKNPGQEKKFHAISVAFDILKDPEKRATYDETGELDDMDDAHSEDAEWKSYFDSLFGKITTNDIDKFAMKYKCSSQEQEDVLKEYTKFKGNLLKMLDCVILSQPRDTQRWVEDYIQPAIDDGTVEDYSSTLQKTLKKAMKKVEQEEEVDDDATETSDDATETSEDSAPKKKKKKIATKAKPTKAKPKKKTKAQREAEAAEELMAKIRGKNALAQRKQGFDAMFEGIKDRYGVTEDDPLAGDEFEKMQAKMLKKSKK